MLLSLSIKYNLSGNRYISILPNIIFLESWFYNDVCVFWLPRYYIWVSYSIQIIVPIII